LFMQISTTFATNGNLSPLIAVWIPNIVFMVIAVLLVKTAPK
jgi:lipopolysaccharide export system permease protein